jgi:hypothetical protein
VAVRKRFQTGDTCEITGRYRFDGYVDGTTAPRPGHKEKMIPIVVTQVFPPIQSTGKACWWRLMN